MSVPASSSRMAQDLFPSLSPAKLVNETKTRDLTEYTNFKKKVQKIVLESLTEGKWEIPTSGISHKTLSHLKERLGSKGFIVFVDDGRRTPTWSEGHGGSIDLPSKIVISLPKRSVSSVDDPSEQKDGYDSDGWEKDFTAREVAGKLAKVSQNEAREIAYNVSSQMLANPTYMAYTFEIKEGVYTEAALKQVVASLNAKGFIARYGWEHKGDTTGYGATWSTYCISCTNQEYLKEGSPLSGIFSAKI